MSIVIAIDGPCGSGKGTISKIVSEKCNLVNIDTGATYRCVALVVLRKGLNLEDEEKIVEISSNIDIKLTKEGKVYLNGEDVTNLIRSKEVTEIVSPISSIVKLRENMVNIQRNMAKDNDVIMEGRDITTVVFPNATYKFYLDADINERVKRRFIQNKENNIDMSIEEIYNSISARDYNDTHKKVGSLTRTEDQIYIDTTNMTVEEVSEEIVKTIKGVNKNEFKRRIY